MSADRLPQWWTGTPDNIAALLSAAAAFWQDTNKSRSPAVGHQREGGSQ
ncbi:hypothetical protein [Natronoglycomyces albus]|uniref:Uncharacterized protein n=1 Tax=Natronoglycomyces albus TaxID=2811108 RepID=A0A895XSJ7_9ACTN|nr:hypothetical protein [Natronoglycomyces albus]QSB06642.1 hypothetical protein JQS30_07035 [Natronoglycomyces albus]